MSILGRAVKQPNEIMDYDVDFTEWFGPRTDTPSSHEAFCEDGLTLVSTALSGNIVKVVVSGGTDGDNYKVTVRLTTTSGIRREVDFIVQVRED